MKLFNRKNINDPGKIIALPPMVHVITEPDRSRPCLARGRRAIFHRWVNSAHPLLPRGMEPGENARYYQYRRTEALVEYEDGTVARIFTSNIQFIDGGDFDKWDWDTLEAQYGTEKE